MSAILNFRLIPHNLISPEEGFNVRKRFNAEKGAELRASIREHGIRNALEVVQVPGEEERYKLASGERRWRENGGLLEDLKREVNEAQEEGDIARLQQLWKDRFEVPVRVLTPEEVPQARMLNLIENLLRDDISPAEEADGYHQALQEVNPETGELYTIEQLSRKLGHPDAQYVTRRLKLRQAPRVLLDAIDEGKVAASVAELVGRIPDPKAREEVAKLILKPTDPAPEQEVPLNYKQTQQLVREHFMRRIDKNSGFDSDDADLVPVKLDEAGVRVCGGSCADCPMRSGMSEELKGELVSGKTRAGKRGSESGVDPNLCTNPGCFRMKQDAAWLIMRRHAEQKGDKVIDGDAARKLFGGYEGRLSYDAKYRPADEQVGSTNGVNWQSPASNMKLSTLAKDLKVPAVVARNPHTGRTEHLVDRAAVIEAAKKAKPDLFKAKKEEGGGGRDSYAEQQKKAKEEGKRRLAVNIECGNALAEAISKTGVGLEEQWVLFEVALEDAGADGSSFLGQWLGIKLDSKERSNSGRDYNKKILEHVKAKASTLPALQAFTVIATLAMHLKPSPWSSGKLNDHVLALAKLYKVDTAAIEKRVRADLAEKAKSKAKAPKKTPGKGEKKVAAKKAGAKKAAKKAE